MAPSTSDAVSTEGPTADPCDDVLTRSSKKKCKKACSKRNLKFSKWYKNGSSQTKGCKRVRVLDMLTGRPYIDMPPTGLRLLPQATEEVEVLPPMQRHFRVDQDAF